MDRIEARKRDRRDMSPEPDLLVPEPESREIATESRETEPESMDPEPAPTTGSVEPTTESVALVNNDNDNVVRETDNDTVIVGERQVGGDSEDAIVIEDNDNDDNDTSDIVITNVAPATSRIRMLPSTFNRDVRRRLNDGTVDTTNADDDDIEILEERQLTPPPPPTLPPPAQRHSTRSLPPLFTEDRHDGSDGYRRELLNRLQSDRTYPFDRLMDSIHLLESQGQLARNQRSGPNGRARRGRGPHHHHIRRPGQEGMSVTDAVFHLLRFEGFGEFPFVFEGGEGNSDNQEHSIMQVIERDNDRALDRKLQDENKFNRKALLEKKDQIKREAKGYTSDIKHEENAGCELCGITLGEGIPEEFKANSQYNLKLSKYIDQFGVRAPWFCFKSLTEVDKELSKRVFLSKCGHLYCGRCIKNIGNRPKRRTKKDTKEFTIENPDISCPYKCLSVACDHVFRGKRSFTELYL